MNTNQTKNEKERVRVRNKKKSLDELRELIELYDETEPKRWTEHYILMKTVDLIHHLEYLLNNNEQ
jgi:hypothetical protein